MADKTYVFGPGFYPVHVWLLVIEDNQIRIVALGGNLKQFGNSGVIFRVTNPTFFATEEVAEDKTGMDFIGDDQNMMWHRS